MLERLWVLDERQQIRSNGFAKFYEQSEIKVDAKHYPSPNFEQSMEHTLKQNGSDLNNSDTRANSPALFRPVSLSIKEAKLGRDGDFIRLTIVR